MKPRDLTLDKLQELIKSDVSYPEIMEMYNINSDRYFKEILKPLGYRLLRGKLWVINDGLWLNAPRGETKGSRRYITENEKQLIVDLYKQGKTYMEIVCETGIPYAFVYKYSDIEKYRKNYNVCKNFRKKKKEKPKVVASKERPMPPINPPGEIKVIHADSEHIERHLQESLGDRLNPVIGPLSMRKPLMNFISQDQFA